MTTPSPVSSKLRLAFLGDSITVGDGDAQARGWPSRLCEITSPIPTKMQCYNLGVGGDRVIDVAGRAGSELHARLTDRTGRGVVVMIGVNDALRAAPKTNSIPLEPNAIKRDLIEVFTQAQMYGAVLAVEPAPVIADLVRADGGTGTEILRYLKEINQLLSLVCEDLGVALLPLTQVLQTDQEFTTALKDGDGLHPIASGYDRIARLISTTDMWSEFLRTANEDV